METEIISNSGTIMELISSIGGNTPIILIIGGIIAALFMWKVNSGKSIGDRKKEHKKISDNIGGNVENIVDGTIPKIEEDIKQIDKEFNDKKKDIYDIIDEHNKKITEEPKDDVIKNKVERITDKWKNI